MQQMLNPKEIGELAQHTLAVIGGALLSMVAPVQAYMVVLLLIIAADLYLAWRVGLKEQGITRFEALKGGVGRCADFFAAMVVTNAFEVRFMEHVPLTYIMGAGIGLIELRRMNAKLIKLHNLDLFKILERFKSGGGPHPPTGSEPR